MGGCCSQDKIEPEEMGMKEDGPGNTSANSRKTLLAYDNPQASKKRSCTDVLFLIIMVLFVISLLGLVGYCIKNGDIYRIVNGYDNCANVCGRVSPPETEREFLCKGADYTSKPYLLIKEGGKAIIDPANIHRECVSDCSAYQGYRQFLNRCVPLPSNGNVNSFFSKTGLADFLEEVSEDLEMCWREVIYICLIALALSVVLLLLFRFVTGLVVWVILIGVVLASVIGTIFLWVHWKEKSNQLKAEGEQSEVDKRTVQSYLAFAVVATIVTVIILLVVLVMRKRISLVVQLFKEAGKALNKMPLLLLEPFITFIALGCVIGISLFFSIWIESSGFLSTRGNQNLYYKKDMAMKFTRWYNLFGLLWFIEFVIDCQNMVIAGAVAKWFFTRNKDRLDYPILESFRKLVRYHLGTVALGSFLIAIVKLFRAILAYFEKTFKDSNSKIIQGLYYCCHCCLYCFEKILKYLSRNAYIETAIYGMSFCRAGKEAFQRLTNNALRVAAINSVGDFVLFLGKALVVIATVLIGLEILKTIEGIQHMWVLLTIGGLFAYIVSHSFIAVYEMVIDTIFLCFCEDCEQNDGLNKPYFMSRELMEFVENCKKALAVNDTRKDYSGATTRSAH